MHILNPNSDEIPETTSSSTSPPKATNTLADLFAIFASAAANNLKQESEEGKPSISILSLNLAIRKELDTILELFGSNQTQLAGPHLAYTILATLAIADVATTIAKPNQKLKNFAEILDQTISKDPNQPETETNQPLTNW